MRYKWGGSFLIKPCPADLLRKITHIEREYLRPILTSHGFRERRFSFRRDFPDHIWIANTIRHYSAATSASACASASEAGIEVEFGVYHPAWNQATDEALFGRFMGELRRAHAVECRSYARLSELAGVDRDAWGALGGKRSADALGRQIRRDLEHHALPWFRSHSDFPTVVKNYAERARRSRSSRFTMAVAMTGCFLIGAMDEAVDFYRAAIQVTDTWDRHSTGLNSRGYQVAQLEEWLRRNLKAH
ncbi:MAG TPA: hypothetical protein VFB54_17350 [Burkholderiales bacterium]|nr:hypothetical protein [Burkholderiales bacterium]